MKERIINMCLYCPYIITIMLSDVLMVEEADIFPIIHDKAFRIREYAKGIITVNVRKDATKHLSKNKKDIRIYTKDIARYNKLVKANMISLGYKFW